MVRPPCLRLLTTNAPPEAASTACIFRMHANIIIRCHRVDDIAKGLRAVLWAGIRASLGPAAPPFGVERRASPMRERWETNTHQVVRRSPHAVRHMHI